MKFLSACVALVVVLGVVNAKCPKYATNPSVSCLVNPCTVNPCADGQICCADYSKGCNRHCLPFQCPSYPVNVNCFVSPCQVNPCADNENCCDDYSTGCDRHCFPKF